MSTIVFPSTREEDGPWLLSEGDLLELDHVLQDVKKLLNRSEDLSLITETSELLLEECHQEVILTSKGGSQILEGSIEKLVQNPHLSNFKPVELRIDIKQGNQSVLKFNLAEDENGFFLDYDIGAKDPDVKYEVKYLLDRWIDKHKPNRIIKLWNNSAGFIAVIAGFVLLIVSFDVFTPTMESYKSKLEREANEIILSGIDSTNLEQAVSILLQREVEYEPADYIGEEVPPSIGSIKTFTISLFFLLIAIIKPVTIIGIGKKSKKIKLMRVWTKVVTVMLPTLLILTPLSKRISDWLY